MRLFIAINPGEETQNVLESIKEEIIIKSGKETASAIKWEPGNKLHLTLFFLGEIRNEIYSGLIKSLSEIKIPEEITFRPTGINAFPDLRNPRVIIAGLGNDDGKANYLYSEITKVMGEYNIAAERGFKPHITLGRVKRQIRLSPEIIKDINSRNRDYGFISGGFELIQSKLTPQGSIYKVLKIFL